MENNLQQSSSPSTESDFGVFKEEFTKYQNLLGLTGYKVYFTYEPMSDFGDITCQHTDMIAMVRLNSQVPEHDLPNVDVKRTAKHEAIHLLLMRLEYLAEERNIRHDEVVAACEEAVNKLGVVIP
jgi:hypothetical protein